jgi:DNA-binding SARP family transcriptional activator
VIFRLLGPLSVGDSLCPVTPTATKQRQVLVLLLLHANRVVTIPQFVEELWEYRPPAKAVAALYTYVMQLRRMLDLVGLSAGTAGNRLITHKGGYEVVVTQGELDVEVFDERVRTAAVTAHPLARASRYRDALSLWAGPPLADVAAGPLLRTATEALQRRRLAAVGHRIDADLELGRHHELIGELTALVYSRPTDERFVAHLMLALYRSGRPADAVMVFHRLRRAVAIESGGRLPDALHRLYLGIVSGDPDLDRPSSVRSRLSLDTVPLGA